MALHPQIVTFLERAAALGVKPIASLSPRAAREQMEALVRARPVPPIPLGAIEDRRIDGPAGSLNIRLYRPPGTAGQSLPALVYFHGGGHVIGSIDTHDAISRALCAGAGIAVVSVDYRLGPEHSFPAAVDDAIGATESIHRQAAALGLRADRIALGGDSAGGNLALVVSLHALKTGAVDVAAQLLVYPVVDYAGGTASYQTYATGYGNLEARTMAWFREHYLRNAGDLQDWRASPGRVASFAGLPPTLVITAECDVLHDEGCTLARRMDTDGVAVEHLDYAGMIHGFFGLAPMIDDAVRAQTEASDFLRRVLHA